MRWYQYLQVNIYMIPRNNEELDAHPLPFKIIKNYTNSFKITLEQIIPILAKIFGSVGTLVSKI